MTAKKEYDILLSSGYFFEMFPYFSGIWADDKEEFHFFWEQNQVALEDADKFTKKKVSFQKESRVKNRNKKYK